MASSLFENKPHSLYLTILILCGLFLFVLGNDCISLTHPDEVFYIQTAKEMIEHQSFLTPYIFDQPQFEKPIFAYWFFVLAIKTFGLNSFAARFSPALFALIGILVTYWLSFVMFRSKRASFLSALILATSLIYIALSRAVLTDMIFSIIILLSISFFYWGMEQEKHRSQGVFLGFLFAGFAVLTKGILGFLFPFFTVLIYLMVTKKKLCSIKVFLVGLGVFLIVALPWHILMFQQYGMSFVHEYWQNVHVRRILEAEHRRLDNWYFYPGLIFAGVIPWSLFWSVVVVGIREQLSKVKVLPPQVIFILAWMFSVFCLTQVAHSKLASYIFPLFPAVAILLSYYINLALEQKDSNHVLAKTLRYSAMLMGMLIFVGICVGVVMAHKYIDFVGEIGPIYGFAVLIGFLSSLIIVFSFQNQVKKVLFVFPFFAVILLLVLFWGRNMAEPWVSCKQISDELNAIDQSSSRVLASKFYLRGIRYYTNRPMAVIDINGEGFFSDHPVPFLNTDQVVLDFLKTQETTYAVVKKSNVLDLERILNQSSFSIEHIKNIGGKYILKIEHL